MIAALLLDTHVVYFHDPALDLGQDWHYLAALSQSRFLHQIQIPVSCPETLPKGVSSAAQRLHLPVLPSLVRCHDGILPGHDPLCRDDQPLHLSAPPPPVHACFHCPTIPGILVLAESLGEIAWQRPLLQPLSHTAVVQGCPPLMYVHQWSKLSLAEACDEWTGLPRP